MPFEVHYGDGEMSLCKNSKEAVQKILECHAGGGDVDEVFEVNDAGQRIAEYGVEWDVKIFPQHFYNPDENTQ